MLAARSSASASIALPATGAADRRGHYAAAKRANDPRSNPSDRRLSRPSSLKQAPAGPLRGARSALFFYSAGRTRRPPRAFPRPITARPNHVHAMSWPPPFASAPRGLRVSRPLDRASLRSGLRRTPRFPARPRIAIRHRRLRRSRLLGWVAREEAATTVGAIRYWPILVGAAGEAAPTARSFGDVAPDRMRRGIGRALITKTLEPCRAEAGHDPGPAGRRPGLLPAASASCRRHRSGFVMPGEKIARLSAAGYSRCVGCAAACATACRPARAEIRPSSRPSAS